MTYVKIGEGGHVQWISAADFRDAQAQAARISAPTNRFYTEREILAAPLSDLLDMPLGMLIEIIGGKAK